MNTDFTKSGNGLVPAIIQDAQTSKVLMLGYMNEEALKKTQSENLVTFYSRSKNRLWTKGETSGNYLKVIHIKTDCDSDALLISVIPSGPVCHLGNDTCFKEENKKPNFIYELENIVNSRKSKPVNGSRISALFEKGINKIAQKVGEEAVELVIEAKDENRELFLNEAADLLFHYLILLSAKETCFDEVLKILKERNKNQSGK